MFRRISALLSKGTERSSHSIPIPCSCPVLPQAVSAGPPQTAAASTGARPRQEEEGAQAASTEKEEAKAEHRRSMLPSPGKDTQSPGEVVQVELHRSNRQLDEEEVDIPLRSGEEERGGDGKKLVPSVPLVGLLVLFFFLYVGIEVGFGAWIAVVVLRDELAGEAGAALMARYADRYPKDGMQDGRGSWRRSTCGRGSDDRAEGLSFFIFFNCPPAPLPSVVGSRAGVVLPSGAASLAPSSGGVPCVALPLLASVGRRVAGGSQIGCAWQNKNKWLLARSPPPPSVATQTAAPLRCSCA